jgi:hypothetical protein
VSKNNSNLSIREYCHTLVNSEDLFQNNFNFKDRKQILRILYQIIIFVFVAFSIFTLTVTLKTQDKNKTFYTFMEICVFLVLIVDYLLR